MKQLLRAQLERRLPTLFHTIRALRNRRFFHSAFGPFQTTISAALYPDGRPVIVRTGPFQGLRYLNETVWGCITPKWLGSYEAELHPVIAEIARRPYQSVIDVGCAEGYYAVGLAVALPAARIITFDADFLSRRQMLRLARLNGVESRILSQSFCQHADLERFAQGRTLVVCDIEGAETHLLDPTLAPSLRRSDILVEVHESSDASTAVENALSARFQPTHRIERLATVPRSIWLDAHAAADFPELSREVMVQAAEEYRATGRVWLWMQTTATAA